eukprot:g77325.t1
MARASRAVLQCQPRSTPVPKIFVSYVAQAVNRPANDLTNVLTRSLCARYVGYFCSEEFPTYLILSKARRNKNKKNKNKQTMQNKTTAVSLSSSLQVLFGHTFYQFRFNSFQMSDSHSDRLLFYGTLIFFANIGFLFLEVGRLPMVHLAAIVQKRMLAIAVCATVYSLAGFDIANSGSASSHPCGSNAFAGFPSGEQWLHGLNSYEPGLVYLQTMAALVVIAAMLGSMAVRVQLTSLLVITAAVSLVSYPVVQFWVWSPCGWLSSGYRGFGGEPLFGTGMFDQGGSGVINLTAGVVATTCAVMLGKHVGLAAKDKDQACGPKYINTISRSTSSGFLFVWLSWFGLTGGLNQPDEIPRAHAFLNTLVCPSLSAAFSLLVSRWCGVKSAQRKYNRLVESCIFGLAAIAAGAGVLSRFAAAGLGMICACVYPLAVRAWDQVGVEDVTGAAAVHAGGGLVGLICTALFQPRLAVAVRGHLLAAQLVGSLAIMAWVASTTFVVCMLVDMFIGLRVSFEEEMGVRSRDLDLVRAYTLPLPDEEDSQEFLQRLTGFVGYLQKQGNEHMAEFLLAVLYFKRRVSNLSFNDSGLDGQTHSYLMKLARTLYLAFCDKPEYLGMSQSMQFALAKQLRTQQQRGLQRGLVDLDLAVIFDECALLVESKLNPQWLQYQDLFQEYLHEKGHSAFQPKSWLRSRGWYKNAQNRWRIYRGLRRISPLATPEIKDMEPDLGLAPKTYFYAVDENTCQVVFKTLAPSTFDVLSRKGSSGNRTLTNAGMAPDVTTNRCNTASPMETKNRKRSRAFFFSRQAPGKGKEQARVEMALSDLVTSAMPEQSPPISPIDLSKIMQELMTIRAQLAALTGAEAKQEAKKSLSALGQDEAGPHTTRPESKFNIHVAPNALLEQHAQQDPTAPTAELFQHAPAGKAPTAPTAPIAPVREGSWELAGAAGSPHHQVEQDNTAESCEKMACAAERRNAIRLHSLSLALPPHRLSQGNIEVETSTSEVSGLAARNKPAVAVLNAPDANPHAAGAAGPTRQPRNSLDQPRRSARIFFPSTPPPQNSRSRTPPDRKRQDASISRSALELLPSATRYWRGRQQDSPVPVLTAHPFQPKFGPPGVDKGRQPDSPVLTAGHFQPEVGTPLLGQTADSIPCLHETAPVSEGFTWTFESDKQQQGEKKKGSPSLTSLMKKGGNGTGPDDGKSKQSRSKQSSSGFDECYEARCMYSSAENLPSRSRSTESPHSAAERQGWNEADAVELSHEVFPPPRRVVPHLSLSEQVEKSK